MTVAYFIDRPKRSSWRLKVQVADDPAGRMTEDVMAALVDAQVLRYDEPNYPTHYNRAFSAVHSAVTLAMARASAARMLAQPPVAKVAEDRGSKKNLAYLLRKGLT